MQVRRKVVPQPTFHQSSLESSVTWTRSPGLQTTERGQTHGLRREEKWRMEEKKRGEFKRRELKRREELKRTEENKTEGAN